MKEETVDCSLGTIIIETKNTPEDKEVFVGSVRMQFKPNLPTKDNAALDCFSMSQPREGISNAYEYLFDWYSNGRCVGSM